MCRAFGYPRVGMSSAAVYVVVYRGAALAKNSSYRQVGKSSAAVYAVVYSRAALAIDFLA